MANIEKLLEKQSNRLKRMQEQPVPTRPRVTIERHGPTRPWQENHPLYQQQPADDAPRDSGAPDQAPAAPVKQPEATGSNREQKRQTTGSSKTVNREQEEQQPGVTGSKKNVSSDQPGATTGSNREQKKDTAPTVTEANREQPGVTGSKKVVSRDQPGATTGSNRKQLGAEASSNREQIPVTPGSSREHSRLQEPLLPVDQPNNREQIPVTPGSLHEHSRLQPGATTGSNREQQVDQPGAKTDDWNRGSDTLPNGLQLLELLRILSTSQLDSGLDTTSRLKRSALATKLQTTGQTVKAQIDRLCQLQHVRRVHSRDGRGDAGTVYQVHRRSIQMLQAIDREQPGATGSNSLLNWEQQPGTTGSNNREQQPGASHSSSSRSKLVMTTTTQGQPSAKELHGRFTQALENFSGTDVLTANDLMQIWRDPKQPFEHIDDLVDSAEHIVAYKRSDAGKDMGKGWLMKTLVKGYYGPPDGFVSWRERRREEVTQRAMARRAQNLADFEADFELWFEELEPAERQRLFADCAGEMVGGFAPLTMIKKTLRDYYARQKGRAEFCSDPEETSAV